MKAKNAKGKTIRHYRNPMLPLMPVPKKANRRDEEVFMVCGYCGGHQARTKDAVMINGLRIHSDHAACIMSARNTLFDMDKRKLQARFTSIPLRLSSEINDISV